MGYAQNNWSGVTGTPWDITNGPSNTAIFGTVGNSASLTAEVYPSAISFDTSTTLSNGGGGVLKYAADNQSKTITVASGKTAAINADITYGGTGTTGNVLFVNGGGTLTLAGTTKLAAADTSHKTSYFNVEGGSTLNVTGRLNTMILNSSNRASSNQYYLGGTSGNNTINVSGSGKLVVGNFNIGSPGNNGNSVYISSPGTNNTSTDPSLNTASMVLYGNSAQLNMNSSDNFVHISNGAFVQQTVGGGFLSWAIGNGSTSNPASNNSLIVTGFGSTIAGRPPGGFTNVGQNAGSGNSFQILSGGLVNGGRIGIGMGNGTDACNNNFQLISGTSDNTLSGVPSFFRENGANNTWSLSGTQLMRAATASAWRQGHGRIFLGQEPPGNLPSAK